jgi:ABC-type sugar transport system permease subunit
VLLVLPTLVIFLVFTLYPILDTIKTSFFRQIMFRPPWFIGLQNYQNLFLDEVFLRSLGNTTIIVAGIFILTLPLAFLLGSFLSQPYPFSGGFKLVIYMPYILSAVMAGLIWTFILDPSMGLINAALGAVGLPGQMWIGGLVLTPYSVFVVEVWRTLGFHVVLFMAGIKMMPKEVLDAASIDGADRWQKTIYVTLPMLKETIKMSAVMILIGSVNCFQTVKMLTNGGPNLRSHTLASYTYYVEFTGMNFGVGSAMAVIILVIALALSIRTLRFSYKDD